MTPLTPRPNDTSRLATLNYRHEVIRPFVRGIEHAMVRQRRHTMRYILIATLAVGLSGCGSNDFFGDSSPNSPTPTPQVVSAASSTEQPASPVIAPDVRCTALAKQRAIDSAYEGEDPDTQRSVFDRSYSDCMAWDAKHRS